MKRLFGVMALAGMFLAAALALGSCLGLDIPATALTITQVCMFTEMFAVMGYAAATLRPGTVVEIRREILAGVLCIVVLVAASFSWRDVPSGGQAKQIGSRFVIVADHGVIVGELTPQAYDAARRAGDRCVAIMTLPFLYLSMLVFLMPGGYWSSGRPRRRGDVFATLRPLKTRGVEVG